MRSSTLQSAAFAALVVAALPLATPAAAQLAPGSTLTFTGAANATDLGSPGVLLAFLGRVTAVPGGATGGFTSLVRPGQPATGSIEDLVVGTGPQQIARVLQFGPYRFTLTALPSGAYGQTDCYVAPAVGQRCTPFQSPGDALSPFYLENAATPGTTDVFTALIAFDVAGTVTAHGVTVPFTGTFSSTFVGASFQAALGGLEATGLAGVPFTGRFVVQAPTAVAVGSVASPSVSVTPEPGTVLLMATGLLGVAAVVRRRRSTAA